MRAPLWCRVFGHKMIERTEIVVHKDLLNKFNVNNVSPSQANVVLESAKIKVYVGEVCKRCALTSCARPTGLPDHAEMMRELFKDTPQ